MGHLLRNMHPSTAIYLSLVRELVPFAFDFVTLTETFADNDFDFSGVLYDFVKLDCHITGEILEVC